MQSESGYANYLSGIGLRVGTSILIEAIAAAAYFAGVIRVENLTGVSVSVGFISLLCIPFWFIMKAAIEAGCPRIPTLVDRFFLLIGFSGLIYSVGGIEATYLIPIYVIVMIYYGSRISACMRAPNHRSPLIRPPHSRSPQSYST
ncbi:MAG: hypothetical protein ABSG21_12215 [Spirochaetia bacterium]